jgi:hypothetical protein
VDLDWFWRAWFYSTDHVDVAITDVRAYTLRSNDPDIDFTADRLEEQRDKPESISIERNRAEGIVPREDRFDELKDLYSDADRFTVTNKDRNEAAKKYNKLDPWEQRALDRAVNEQSIYYFVDFENKGGVPSTIPLTIFYRDGEQRERVLPAEIWRRDNKKVTYRLVESRPIEAIETDVKHQTADANTGNNRFPPTIETSRLEAYKSKRDVRNLMADLLVELKKKDDDASTERDIPLTPAVVD